MAKINKEDFINSLKEMKILEVKELVDAIQEEFGINLNAMAVASPTVTADTKEEPSIVNVVLTNAGANKIQVIKLIRDITGLGLSEAKGIVDAGGNIKTNVKIDEANEIKTKLEEVGATVEFK